jgi:hypothetical protein
MLCSVICFIGSTILEYPDQFLFPKYDATPPVANFFENSGYFLSHSF